MAMHLRGERHNVAASISMDDLNGLRRAVGRRLRHEADGAAGAARKHLPMQFQVLGCFKMGEWVREPARETPVRVVAPSQ